MCDVISDNYICISGKLHASIFECLNWRHCRIYQRAGKLEILRESTQSRTIARSCHSAGEEGGGEVKYLFGNVVSCDKTLHSRHLKCRPTAKGTTRHRLRRNRPLIVETEMSSLIYKTEFSFLTRVRNTLGSKAALPILANVLFMLSTSYVNSWRQIIGLNVLLNFIITVNCVNECLAMRKCCVACINVNVEVIYTGMSATRKTDKVNKYIYSLHRRSKQ